jgi:hypothetical protein
MQCKDIPDRPIIEMLDRNPGQWHNWCFANEYDVTRAMPEGTPEKLKLAKMRVLIGRGLVDGCPCGCRGDFVITTKGQALLNTQP